MIQAVLFDLDGTLLPLDVDEFFTRYVPLLHKRFSHLASLDEFAKRLMASTHMMMNNADPGSTLERVFWDHFSPSMGVRKEDIIDSVNDFYRTDFACLRGSLEPDPRARRAVTAALSAGFDIVLATNPVFPMEAITERMAWAGIDDLPWKLITSYEEMHFSKPNPLYYREIAGMIGTPPDACLMAGNDTRDDLSASLVGMKTFLVTGFDIERGTGLAPHYRGSLDDLRALIERRFDE